MTCLAPFTVSKMIKRAEDVKSLTIDVSEDLFLIVKSLFNVLNEMQTETLNKKQKKRIRKIATNIDRLFNTIDKENSKRMTL